MTAELLEIWDLWIPLWEQILRNIRLKTEYVQRIIDFEDGLKEKLWKLKSKIDLQEALIAEQRKQLLSEKKKCMWFFYEGIRFSRPLDEYGIDFERAWEIWISSMPADIQKRKEMKKK